VCRARGYEASGRDGRVFFSWRNIHFDAFGETVSKNQIVYEQIGRAKTRDREAVSTRFPRCLWPKCELAEADRARANNIGLGLGRPERNARRWTCGRRRVSCGGRCPSASLSDLVRRLGRSKGAAARQFEQRGRRHHHRRHPTSVMDIPRLISPRHLISR
jgi:hypothetical protein